MSGSLVEVAREVARGTELKVALGTPVLGIVLRVGHDHSRMERRVFGQKSRG
jgi:hypothetical protein